MTVQTTEDTPMNKADWLRAIQAWLDMPEMREQVIFHLNEAADYIEELEADADYNKHSRVA